MSMFKSLTNAVSATARTVEKTANTLEHTVDLADREVALLQTRQEIRMAEIKKELIAKRDALGLTSES